MALQEVLAQRAREAGDVYLPGYTHMQRAQPVLAGPPLARARLGAGPRRRPPGHDGRPAEHVAARARARWPDRRCRSTPTTSRRSSGSTGASRTRSTRSRTATSWPSRSSTLPCWACTCLGWVRRSCCGRPRSSASAPSTIAYADRQLDAAPEEEPRRRRARPRQDGPFAGQPCGGARDAEGTSARLQPRPAGGQGAVVRLGAAGRPGAGGAARRLRDGHVERGPDARRRPTGPPPPPSTWPRCSSSRAWPFRQAHALVGGLVRESLERHVPLVELVAAHPDLGEAAVELLEPGVAVTRRRTPGGAGPGPVAEQSERFARRLEVDRTRLAQWRPAGSPARRRPHPESTLIGGSALAPLALRIAGRRMTPAVCCVG